MLLLSVVLLGDLPSHVTGLDAANVTAAREPKRCGPVPGRESSFTGRIPVLPYFFSAATCWRRAARQLSRCLRIQSSNARSKPMS
ncbi:MAG: hypothetical protein JWM88_1409 [Verrucomicrobia bacterium]|nr:hypothetical protein [Verrucomicrobiota bacterium]